MSDESASNKGQATLRLADKDAVDERDDGPVVDDSTPESESSSAEEVGEDDGNSVSEWDYYEPIEQALHRFTHRSTVARALKRCLWRRALAGRVPKLTDAVLDRIIDSPRRGDVYVGKFKIGAASDSQQVTLTRYDWLEVICGASEASQDRARRCVTFLGDPKSRLALSRVREQVVSQVFKAGDDQAEGKSLEEQWRLRAYIRLEAMIKVATEAARAFTCRHQPKRNRGPSSLQLALTALHARSVQVCREVVPLLKAGHETGIRLLWQMLHEFMVISLFLSSRGESLATLYLDHGAVTRYRLAHEFQGRAASLGLDIPCDFEVGALEKQQAQAIARHGARFAGEYGWASAELKMAQPTFARIEQVVELRRWTPYLKTRYRVPDMGLNRLFSCFGVLKPDLSRVSYGAQNALANEYAQNAALALLMTTCVLLTMDANIDDLVVCGVMQVLADDFECTLAHAEASA